MNVDLLPVRIYRKDLQGRFIYANATCLREFRIDDPGHFFGKTDFDFFDAELAEKWRIQEDHLAKSGESFYGQIEEEKWLLRSPTWAQTSKSIEYGEDGNATILGVSIDITTQYSEKLRFQRAVECLLRFQDRKYLRPSRRFRESLARHNSRPRDFRWPASVQSSRAFAAQIVRACA